MSFSIKERQQAIAKLKTTLVDLLIIGGGITGAGVALQASAAGIKTALIEMQDFAGGTSSRSTRLVHGGIRYLKTFDVEVVAETTQERAIIQSLAPHLTRPDPMLLPIYDEPGTTFTMFSVKVAMDLYDHLAGLDQNPHLQKYTNYTIDKEETLRREPQLNPGHLVGAGVYLDYQNNDARLVIENIKRAHEFGGMMLSRIKALEIMHDDNGQVNGTLVEDLLTHERFIIKAKVVINTTGPWSDKVRQLDQDIPHQHQMRPTKGIHLVVDQSRLQVPQPTYFGSGTNDGRMIFTIPREGKTYFGTTDTDYHGDYVNPTVSQNDVDYLLAIINKKYPKAHLTIADVETSWAGIRPLIAPAKSSDEVDAVSGASNAGALEPSAVSRGSSLVVDHDHLVTLAGGKLTDYRIMAAGAMKKIRELLKQQHDLEFPAIDSRKIKVSGGNFDADHATQELVDFAKMGKQASFSPAEATEMATLFGSNTPQIIELATKLKPAPGLSLAETAALRYSLENEMTLTPIDYLLRRTNHVLFHADSIDRIKQPVVAEMGRFYRWDQAMQANYLRQLDEELKQSRLVDLKQANV